MCWPDTLGGAGAPSVEQIILRLAYHLHHRTRDPDVAETVLQDARITRRTLSRYACYRLATPSVGGDLHAAGPRRLDLYAAICLAMGDSPGKVLWAATVAGDYPSMLALLGANVRLQPRLLLVVDPEASEASESTSFEVAARLREA